MTRGSQRTSEWDVAVIGMAGRFPGAKDVDALWQNLRDGVDMVARFPGQTEAPG